jgi:hypothetical protein
LKELFYFTERSDRESINIGSLLNSLKISPETGVLHQKGVPGFSRPDVANLHLGKLALDATAPVAMKKQFARRKFPGIEKIDLGEYLGERFGSR